MRSVVVERRLASGMFQVVLDEALAAPDPLGEKMPWQGSARRVNGNAHVRILGACFWIDTGYFLLRDESVSRAINGLQMLWLRRVGLQLLPQFKYLVIDGARSWI